MNWIYIVLTSLSLVFSSDADSSFNKLSGALESGNSDKIVEMIDAKVMMNLGGTDGVYSKQQAKLVLKDFFAKHPCKSFKYTHRTSSGNQGALATGEYFSEKKYSVTVQLQNKLNVYYLEKLTIK